MYIDLFICLHYHMGRLYIVKNVIFIDEHNNQFESIALKSHSMTTWQFSCCRSNVVKPVLSISTSRRTWCQLLYFIKQQQHLVSITLLYQTTWALCVNGSPLMKRYEHQVSITPSSGRLVANSVCLLKASAHKCQWLFAYIWCNNYSKRWYLDD